MLHVKTTRISKLLTQANQLPAAPGCYLMKAVDGTIIYVGKAKNLKSRVSSYFNGSNKTPKTEILVGHIHYFDFILAETEVESLILENNLIKKNRPKYNIRLKDDKSYPYLVVNTNEKFPRLEYKRRVKKAKGIMIFGPFVLGSNISSILKTLTKAFSLRDCSLREFNSRKEPCLLYQLKQCSAPCVGKITEEQYQRDLELALNFFTGKGNKSLLYLQNQMEKFSGLQEYERAALIRDVLTDLIQFQSYISDQNTQSLTTLGDVDIVASYHGDLEVDIGLYMIRNGILVGTKNFHFFNEMTYENEEETIIQCIYQYYSMTEDSPPKIICIDSSADQLDLLEKALHEGLNSSTKVKTVTKKFQGLHLLAKQFAQENQRIRYSNEDNIELGMEKLKNLLSLKEKPQLLECVDIAIWQGKSPTASQVVFHQGRPDKKSYRYYHLKERPEGNNDFAMMKEFISRRVKYKNLPDVLIVDGGKGQVSSVIAALKEEGIELPVVGIAKSKLKETGEGHKQRSEERLIIPGRSNPFILKKSPALFRLVVQMRDEAHRFSRKLHHKAEKKRTFRTWIDQIQFIGPKGKASILKNLKHTPDELKKFTVEQLKSLFELNSTQAKSLKEWLIQNEFNSKYE